MRRGWAAVGLAQTYRVDVRREGTRALRSGTTRTNRSLGVGCLPRKPRACRLRLEFRPDGEAAPLFCDLFDKTTWTLYKAEGTVTRAAVRMAIGQLADYARLVEPRRRERFFSRSVPEMISSPWLRLRESKSFGHISGASRSTRPANPHAVGPRPAIRPHQRRCLACSVRAFRYGNVGQSEGVLNPAPLK
jgi:hypothetical protein